MNLALLDPFRRQVPDRIDSTLTIPRSLHPSRPKRKASDVAPPSGAAAGGGATANASTATSASSGGGSGDEGGGAPPLPKNKRHALSSKARGSGTGGESVLVEKGDGRVAQKRSASARGEAGSQIPRKRRRPKDGGEGVDDDEVDDDVRERRVGGGNNDKSKSEDDEGEDRKNDEDRTEAGTGLGAIPKSGGVVCGSDYEAPSSGRRVREGDGEVGGGEGLDDEDEDDRTTGSDAAATTDAVGGRGGKRGSADQGGEDAENDNDAAEAYWTACYAVSFNRRGSFLASGHASGLVPCHDFMSRTVSALYQPPPPHSSMNGAGNGGCCEEDVATKKIKKRSVKEMKGKFGKGAKRKSKGGKSGEKGEDSDSEDNKSEGDDEDGDENVSAGVSRSERIDRDHGETASASGADAASRGEWKARAGSGSAAATAEDDGETQLNYLNGVTSLSWDRRSRTLLAGAIGDRNLRLMDNTHPRVCLDIGEAVGKQHLSSSAPSSAASGCGGGGGGTAGGGDGAVDVAAATTPSSLDADQASGEVGGGNGVAESMAPSKKKKGSSKDGASSPMPSLSSSPIVSPPRLSPQHRGSIVKEVKFPVDDSESGEGGAIVSVRLETVSYGRARLLRGKIVALAPPTTDDSVGSQKKVPPPQPKQRRRKGEPKQPSPPKSQPPQQQQPSSQQRRGHMITVPARRHQVLLLALPQKLGGPAQLHPRDNHTGLACMIDGSLALFSIPPSAFYEALPSPTMAKSSWAQSLLEEEAAKSGSVSYLIPPPQEGKGRPRYAVTCAAFGKNNIVYAVTKCGTLLGFRLLPKAMSSFVASKTSTRGGGTEHASVRSSAPSPWAVGADHCAAATTAASTSPAFRIKVPGGAAAWQIIVSRNGSVLINSADCALRLYDTEELSRAFDTASGGRSGGKGGLKKPVGGDSSTMVKPRFVFQDLVSKAPWASCDFSGDGEYVVGGCNSYPQPGDNYQLFLWNTATGELIDQLTGPQVSLYSLSCHPTRPFIAVGTSDGLVDVWGPRMDWTAFAPDFQALQQNVEYEEREDEFDVVIDGNARDDAEKKDSDANSEEDAIVDIHTKERAFNSDSEDETDVFHFDTNVKKIHTWK